MAHNSREAEEGVGLGSLHREQGTGVGLIRLERAVRSAEAQVTPVLGEHKVQRGEDLVHALNVADAGIQLRVDEKNSLQENQSQCEICAHMHRSRLSAPPT